GGRPVPGDADDSHQERDDDERKCSGKQPEGNIPVPEPPSEPVRPGNGLPGRDHENLSCRFLLQCRSSVIRSPHPLAPSPTRGEGRRGAQFYCAGEVKTGVPPTVICSSFWIASSLTGSGSGA